MRLVRTPEGVAEASSGARSSGDSSSAFVSADDHGARRMHLSYNIPYNIKSENPKYINNNRYTESCDSLLCEKLIQECEHLCRLGIISDNAESFFMIMEDSYFGGYPLIWVDADFIGSIMIITVENPISTLASFKLK